jgi:hypothetical protein
MNTTDKNQKLIGETVGLLGGCADRFGALRVLFNTIAKGLKEGDDLRLLAIAGADIAFDQENAAGSWKEQVERNWTSQ